MNPQLYVGNNKKNKKWRKKIQISFKWYYSKVSVTIAMVFVYNVLSHFVIFQEYFSCHIPQDQ